MFHVCDYGKCLKDLRSKGNVYFIPSLPLIYTHDAQGHMVSANEQGFN